MAGVADTKPVELQAFGGIDNLNPIDALRKGAVREAVNVDLNTAGQAQLRGGYREAVPGVYGHSLFGCSFGLVGVLDNALVVSAGTVASTHTVRAGMAPRELSYAELNGDVYWMNGVEFGRIRGHDYADTRGWIDNPGTPRASVTTNGGMAPGDYQVALTFTDADGRESGSDLANYLTVPAGGGIRLDDITYPADAVAVRIWVTDPNGGDDEAGLATVLRHYRTLPAGLTYLTVGAGNGPRGKVLETQFLTPLPPGQILRSHNARLWVAAGNTLHFGEASRYGLCHPDNAFRFYAPIDLLEPVGQGQTSGIFIACGGAGGEAGGRTFWLTFADDKSSSRVVCYPHGAVPGSGGCAPGKLFGLDTTGDVAFWVSWNGVFCVGLPTGQVLPLTEGQLAIPVGTRGAPLVREAKGLRQILMAMRGQVVGSGLAVGDAVATTIRRNGVDIS